MVQIDTSPASGATTRWACDAVLAILIMLSANESIANADADTASPAAVDVVAIETQAGAARIVPRTDGRAAKPPCGDGSRPRIGLVLGGGGAKGAAHVGVLRELEALRVPIDCIVGTSVGAIVGGLYTSGYTPAEVADVIADIDWDDMFDDQIPRSDRSFRRKREDDRFLVKYKPGFNDGELQFPAGLIQGQKIDLLLSKLTLSVARVDDFDQFTIPYRAVAADLVTGDAVVLKSGNLAQAIRASMSVPAIFSPVEIDGQILVDGGMANNVPVNVARDMGADILIVVDVGAAPKSREEITSVLSVTEQLTALLTRNNTRRQLATLSEQDIYINPSLGDIGSEDFDRVAEAFPLGDVAARKHKAALSRLSLAENVYASHLAARVRPSKEPPVVEFLSLQNHSPLADKVLQDRFATLQTDGPLDVADLERHIGRIYGLEMFQNMRYEIVDDNGHTGVLVDAKERAWGPNYLQFGLLLSDNFNGDNFFDLIASYVRTGINPLGGELRSFASIGELPGLFGEWYQPLDARGRYFVETLIGYQRSNVNVFDDSGDIVSEFRVTQYGGSVAAGREFGQWGELRLGLRRSSGDADVRVGVPGQDISFNTGDAFVRMSVDRLDNVNFPRHGGQLSAEYSIARKTLGADEKFEQYSFAATGVRTWDQHTLLGAVNWSGTRDDNAPIQSRFNLGGLFSLSGFQLNELSGQHAGLGALAYYHRLGNMPAYAGMTLELGNVWQDQSDVDFDDAIFAGSLFFGADTAIGPFYLGYGRSEKGNDALYLVLGRVFGLSGGNLFRE